MGDVYIESVCNGFLDNNPQVTNVSGMFRLCYRLSYLPETLLSKLTHLNDASYFMTECGDTVAGTNLYIDTDADNLDVTVFYIPYNLETDSVGTGSINVHCKNESVAYNAFSSLNSSYINLIGY